MPPFQSRSTGARRIARISSSPESASALGRRARAAPARSRAIRLAPRSHTPPPALSLLARVVVPRRARQIEQAPALEPSASSGSGSGSTKTWRWSNAARSFARRISSRPLPNTSPDMSPIPTTVNALALGVAAELGEVALHAQPRAARGDRLASCGRSRCCRRSRTRRRARSPRSAATRFATSERCAVPLSAATTRYGSSPSWRTTRAGATTQPAAHVVGEPEQRRDEARVQAVGLGARRARVGRRRARSAKPPFAPTGTISPFFTICVRPQAEHLGADVLRRGRSSAGRRARPGRRAGARRPARSECTKISTSGAARAVRAPRAESSLKRELVAAPPDRAGTKKLVRSVAWIRFSSTREHAVLGAARDRLARAGERAQRLGQRAVAARAQRGIEARAEELRAARASPRGDARSASRASRAAGAWPICRAYSRYARSTSTERQSRSAPRIRRFRSSLSTRPESAARRPSSARASTSPAAPAPGAIGSIRNETIQSAGARERAHLGRGRVDHAHAELVHHRQQVGQVGPLAQVDLEPVRARVAVLGGEVEPELDLASRPRAGAPGGARRARPRPADVVTRYDSGNASA